MKKLVLLCGALALLALGVRAQTPEYTAKTTGGNSLASNIQLVYNNARLAAKTAAAYCAL